MGVSADRGLVDIGVAEWHLEPESGDAYVVEPFQDGVLVAVIDGLGHGPEAAIAARAAQQALTAHAREAPQQLLAACHDALRQTRGAVISLAALRADSTAALAGVGNVQAALVPRRMGIATQLLAPRGGILGHDLPAIHVVTKTLATGDTLVFATDGVRPQSIEARNHRLGPQLNADRILADGKTGRDDALVLVARYRGAPE